MHEKVDRFTNKKANSAIQWFALIRRFASQYTGGLFAIMKTKKEDKRVRQRQNDRQGDKDEDRAEKEEARDGTERQRFREINIHWID